jgi:hypothetical protein
MTPAIALIFANIRPDPRVRANRFDVGTWQYLAYKRRHCLSSVRSIRAACAANVPQAGARSVCRRGQTRPSRAKTMESVGFSLILRNRQGQWFPTLISVVMIRERGTLRRNCRNLVISITLLLGLASSAAQSAPFRQNRATDWAVLAPAPAEWGRATLQELRPAAGNLDSRWLPTEATTTSPIVTLLLPDGASRGAGSARSLAAFEPGGAPAIGISLTFRANRTSLPDSDPTTVAASGQSAPLDADADLLTIPEPASVVLLITGLAGLCARRSLRRRGLLGGNAKRIEPTRS